MFAQCMNSNSVQGYHTILVLVEDINVKLSSVELFRTIIVTQKVGASL